ncbi:MAG: ribosomal protein S18-alanine N-acetyltransferase [Candidatus Cloacimonetes bacterium]|nr:ribosomal protein S18-alanine N-acetyltransferase [Candidatus Cloacimonadota bacterium]
MNICIREFCEADLKQLAVLENELFSAPWSEAMLLESCQKGYSWVMETETGEIIGYLIGELVLDEFSLYNLAISESRQNHGFGFRFLTFLKEKMRQLACRKIFLEVRSRNQSAISLYRKSGFQPLYLRRNYYSQPVDDALTMVYELKQEGNTDEKL